MIYSVSWTDGTDPNSDGCGFIIARAIVLTIVVFRLMQLVISHRTEAPRSAE